MVEKVPRERVDKFTWERLMLVSGLPFATRAVLMMLAVYMSDDGGSAHPGLDNLMLVTRRGRSVLIEHLNAAVKAGYLDQVERGGYRGSRLGRRASVYVATVPKEIFARGMEILSSPPWKRRSDGPDVESTSDGPDVDSSEVREIDVWTPSEGPVLPSEGPVLRESTSGGPDPINPVFINPGDINHGRPRPSDPSGSPAGAVCSTCKGKRFVVTGAGVSDYCRCHPLYENRTAA